MFTREQGGMSFVEKYLTKEQEISCSVVHLLRHFRVSTRTKVMFAREQEITEYYWYVVFEKICG